VNGLVGFSDVVRGDLRSSLNTGVTSTHYINTYLKERKEVDSANIYDFHTRCEVSH
jgi:hypothetical protein